MKRSYFFIVSAILALFFAAGLLFTPVQFLSSFGFSVDTLGVILARDYSTAMIAFAVLLLVARNEKGSVALKAILYAWGILHLTEIFVNMVPITSGIVPVSKIIGPFILHGLMVFGSVWYVLKMKEGE